VTVVAQATLENPPLSGEIDVVQRLTDLPLGIVAPAHSHPGPNFNVVYQGEIILNMAGTARTYRTGDSWVELAGVVHDAVGTSPATARVLNSALVPRGASVAIPAQPSAAAQPPAPVQLPSMLPRTGELPPGALVPVLLGLALLVGGRLLHRRPD
jgi:quercetin dioxygenase-like cupin family protein